MKKTCIKLLSSATLIICMLFSFLGVNGNATDTYCFCSKCGNSIPVGSTFCMYCGTRLENFTSDSTNNHISSDLLYSSTGSNNSQSISQIDNYLGTQDYVLVSCGDEIKIKNVGRYSFSSFHPSGTLTARNGLWDTDFVGSNICCTYINTSSSTKYFGKDEGALINATLVFLTDDGEYKYKYHSEGRLISRSEGMSYELTVAHGAMVFPWDVEPMESAQITLWYDTPELLQTSKDGTIFLMLEGGSQTYIILLRDNGTNLF